MKITEKDIILVGIDVGYLTTKIALPGGGLIQVPSRVTESITDQIEVGLSLDSADDYSTNNELFTILTDGKCETRDDTDFHFSAKGRVTVHHALRTAGLAGRAVKIGTEMPVSLYYSGNGGRANIAVIDKKMRTTLVPVKALRGPPCADIASNHILADGIAAWLDFSIDSKGNVISNPARPVVVIDIGGRSTDCVTVLPGLKVDLKRSGTSNVGTLAFLGLIRDRLIEKYDLPDIETAALERCSKIEQIRVLDKDFDISDIVRDAKRAVGDRIHREIQKQIGRGHEFEKVIFVGDGAESFEPLQRFYPNAVMPLQPEFASARGLLKYLTYLL